jgi:hypothetical protein
LYIKVNVVSPTLNPEAAKIKMDILTKIATVLGILVAILGIVGGLLSLPASIRKLRREIAPHGDKGVGFSVLKRDDKPEGTEISFLVVEDLFHFIGSVCKPEWRGRITNLEAVGEYYKVDVEWPPGTDLRFLVTKKKT